MVMNRHFGLCWCGQPIKYKKPPGFCGNDDHRKIWNSATAWWSEFRILMARADMICRICGVVPVVKQHGQRGNYWYMTTDGIVADHIVPIKLGGWCYDEGNVQALCSKCNIEKTKKDLSEIWFATHDPKPKIKKPAAGPDHPFRETGFEGDILNARVFHVLRGGRV